MSDKLECSGCGMPLEAASKLGVSFELQKDGSILCDLCKKFIPVLDKHYRDDIINRSKDFASYIESSACMFKLDSIVVLFSTGQIFIESVNQISMNDKEHAVALVEKYMKDLEVLKAKIKEGKLEFDEVTS